MSGIFERDKIEHPAIIHMNNPLLPFDTKEQTDKWEWLTEMRPHSEIPPTLLNEKHSKQVTDPRHRHRFVRRHKSFPHVLSVIVLCLPLYPSFSYFPQTQGVFRIVQITLF